MTARIMFTVDGQKGTEGDWAALCRNVSRSTVRTRLRSGIATLAELDSPPAGDGYAEKPVIRQQMVDVAINGWRRRGAPAQLVGRI